MKYLILFMPFACMADQGYEINTMIQEVRSFTIKEFAKSEKFADGCQDEDFAVYHFARGRSSAFSDVIYFIDHQK